MNAFVLKAVAGGVFLALSAASMSQLGAPQPDKPLAAGPDPSAAVILNEGYFVVNGISYYTREGQAFRVEREVSLRVTPKGIFGFDGKALALKRGLMITPDGRHAPIPPGINIENLPERSSSQGDPRETSSGSL